jgi:hypothetical protein
MRVHVAGERPGIIMRLPAENCRLDRRRRHSRNDVFSSAMGVHVGMRLPAALALLSLAPLVGASRPADNPCVTWVQGSCSVSGIDPSKFIPAIYSAWMWHPNGACGSKNMSGSCSRCSGRPGDFSCGYIFPCFADGPDIWGHKDVCASEGPCIAHLPASESNVSSQTCPSWYPGKGPQWEHWG